eukprot:gb/GFBE01066074.1/.p1 GENE.gb/GFBE01066074.1/~~gb/GFBE01066074.1/.p1  ORF type:complete len:214 (+),score=61.76 gb/GFBE01066074.1/:1-642(+)
MAALKDIEACRDALKACRTAAGDDVSGAINALKRLADLTIDAAALRSTGIGKEVNDRFFRTHANAEVKERCANLVHAWKAMALGGTAPAPAAAAQAEKPRAAPEKKKAETRSGSPKAKKAKTAASAVNHDGPNEELAKLFDELSSFEFKVNKFAGIAFKKVSAILRGLDEKVTSGASIAALPGIGKETVKKIDQYLETGTIEKLEKHRKGEVE